MTNFIKKIMLSATLGLALVTPVMALGTDIPTDPVVKCAPGMDKASVLATLTANEKIKVTDVTKSYPSIVKKKGPPPHAEGDADIEAYLAVTDVAGVISIFQHGCFIDQLGPAMKSNILDVLGMSAL